MKINGEIKSQFCTCHDSTAVLACAQLWPDLTIIYYVRVTRNLARFELSAHNIFCELGPGQGWGQIRFIKYKYKYKYIFFRSFKYKYKYKYTGKNLIKYKYKYKYSSSNTNTHTNTNTQWGRDKIAAILQMTYWNLLYCKKIVYTFKFHWKLFPKVQSTISLHWFR